MNHGGGLHGISKEEHRDMYVAITSCVHSWSGRTLKSIEFIMPTYRYRTIEMKKSREMSPGQVHEGKKSISGEIKEDKCGGYF